jgi:very-short-patch-repair endonuclease
VLACEPSAHLSHGSAAWLWGLQRRSGQIHVTAPTRRHGKPEFRIHHAALALEDLDACSEIPMTSVGRTLVDLAASARPARLDRILERAEELRVLDLRAVEEAILRAKTHSGVRALRGALGLYRPEPRLMRSRVERRFLELVRDAGLPMPATNCFVEGYELDAYWAQHRFAVELDTYEFHGSRAAFERDRLRQEDLKLVGIEMIRVTGRRLDRARPRVESIAELLRPCCDGQRPALD